jgi:magnesium-transporting ATPase (P-type)
VNTLVFGQIFYLFNCRYLDESSISAGRLFANRAVWMTTGILLVLQLVFVYAPFMNTWFGSAPLLARHWLIPLSIGCAVFLAVEAEKALTRRWSGR